MKADVLCRLDIHHNVMYWGRTERHAVKWQNHHETAKKSFQILRSGGDVVHIVSRSLKCKVLATMDLSDLRYVLNSTFRFVRLVAS